MIPGSAFVDILPLFEADPETHAIVMIGEIGGSEEELAAEYIKKPYEKTGGRPDCREKRTEGQEYGTCRSHCVGRRHGKRGKQGKAS